MELLEEPFKGEIDETLGKLEDVDEELPLEFFVVDPEPDGVPLS